MQGKIAWGNTSPNALALPGQRKEGEITENTNEYSLWKDFPLHAEIGTWVSILISRSCFLIHHMSKSRRLSITMCFDNQIFLSMCFG